MTRTTTTFVLIAGLTLCGTAAAQGQTKAPGSAYIDVNFGYQTSSHTLISNSSFPLYDETATINTTQSIPGGFLFDFGGGYRIWRNLAVGLAFSNFSETQTATVTAHIPDPAVYDQFTTINVQSPGLERSEFGTHIKAVYFIRLTDNIDVAVSGGPSFIHVSQDLSTVTVPPGSQTVNIAVSKETGTAAGGNIGFDVNYMVTQRYGAGFFLRYAGGSVDLPGAGSTKAGGLQLGVGARIRF